MYDGLNKSEKSLDKTNESLSSNFVSTKGGEE